MANVQSFPNVLAADAEKKQPQYGLQFLKAVYGSWVDGGLMGGESRVNRKNRFDYNRSFAMGKQNMQEYLDILDVDGANSVINLAYDPLPIAIPFLNRIKDKYKQRVEKVACNTIDPFSQSKKKTARDNAVFKMQEGSRIAALQQESGVNIEDFKDDDPTDENEIDVEFGFNYKLDEEILMENGIEMVFYENSWDDVCKDSIIDDICNCGYAPACVEVDANGRIKTRLIRPENFISSASQWNDFRDWQYQGECYYMSIMDIRQMYQGKVSEQKLWDLARSNAGRCGNPGSFDYSWDYNFSNAPSRPYDSFRVEVVKVVLKTLNNINFEVSNDSFGKTVLDKKVVKQDGKEYISSPAFYVSYTGVMIVESDLLLEWSLSKDMVKPEQNLQEILSPYVIYMHNNTKMGNTPLIETMIPSIKIMQLTWLQQQKIIAAAAPDGYDVDIAYMSDITLGDGMSDLSPHQLYKIYKQTGIRYYKSISDDGEDQRHIPIQANTVPFSTKLEQLMGVWNAEYLKLQQIVGDNNAASGNITNQAIGKEVLQNARQISESASNYIYDAYLNTEKRIAKLIQLRLWDILVYGKRFGVFYYDGYRKALGTDKVENIKLASTGDLEKTAFDVMIQVVIDDNAQIQLNNDINQALAQKLIEFHDAIDIRRVAIVDLKYASYMMAARIKKRKREADEQAEKNSQMAMQGNAQAAQAKYQGEIGLENVKATNKSKELVMQFENQKELEVQKSLGIIKSEVAKGVLAEPGKSWKDIPAFVFDGMGIADQSMKQIIAAQMQAQAVEAQQQQMAIQQQAQAEQQPQQQEQQAA